MLEELEIRDLGPIRHALIAPAAGMTAITGETGAGKSMLLSAIRLISGGSADAGRVSPGAKQAWAQGVFAVDASAKEASDAGKPEDSGDVTGADVVAREPGVIDIVRDAGVEPEDGELFLSRTVPSSGRSRAVLNGRSVPRSVLGAVAGRLVTIHGQADQLRIASSARQREFVDMVAADAAELAAYRKAWDALGALEARLERMEHQEASARQRADYLRESIERINRVNPKPGEDDELKAKRSRIEHAAEIAQGVGGALSALDSSQVDVDADTPSAVELIDHAAQSLRSIHAEGDFGQLADRLESIGTDLSDVVDSLAARLDSGDDMDDLDSINGRIHELGELTRRWGPTIADVIAWRDKAVFDVEDLDASPEKIAELAEQRESLRKRALKAADALHKAREAAAKRLASRVTAELESLAMSGASLEIRVTMRTGDGALDASGGDDIAFLFTPYEGSPQLPMGKSASGGELSRLMLALELSAADMNENTSAADPASAGASSADSATADAASNASSPDAGGARAGMTFIFDEVDAGVGGKTAVELGRRLARLAKRSQVIVVTHLAQVASWADSQFAVTKVPPDADDDDLGVITTVAGVSGEDRVHEIARMLSGSESEASLDHARELLSASRL